MLTDSKCQPGIIKVKIHILSDKKSWIFSFWSAAGRRLTQSKLNAGIEGLGKVEEDERLGREEEREKEKERDFKFSHF